VLERRLKAAGAIAMSRGQDGARRVSYLSLRISVRCLSAASMLILVLSMPAGRWAHVAPLSALPASSPP
jgi:hypothetical protein